MAESIPYQYIDSTGVIIADSSGLLADVQSEYQSVFGADLIVTPDTPQGVLMAAETLARIEVVNNNAAVANQVNPNISEGVFLDALLALTGMQRTTSTQTLVTNVTLTGVPGTVISAGTQAQTAAGDLFASLSNVTLDSTGVATVNFASTIFGPIPCAGNTLNQVVTNVLGWETVNNNPSGTPTSVTTLGTTTQSDQAARALRNNTLAFNGISLAEAITSALYAVSSVSSLVFRENVADTTQTIDGISLISHSIYVCINGGSDLNVAAALLENKSSGCAWNGGTSVNIIEPASGQTYAVKFDRPSQIGILIRVTTTNGSVANIEQAILDYAAGSINGFTGFVVGGDVSPFEIAGAITSRYPNYYISKVEISLTSPVSYSTNAIAIGINEIAQTQLSYLNVIIS